MAHKDAAERKAYQKRYKQTHPYLDTRTYASRREYMQKYQRKYRWRVMGLPNPTRPEPEWCECCGRLSDSALHLDHDHTTGKFRGWICVGCNLGLGSLGDNIAALEQALAYLKRAADGA